MPEGEAGVWCPVRGDSAHQLGPAAWLPGQGLATQHVLQSTQVTNICIYIYIMWVSSWRIERIYKEMGCPNYTFLKWEEEKSVVGNLCLCQCCGSASIIMRIRIRDPKNFHMDPDPRGYRLKKKNYTKKISTKSFKMTLKNH